MRGSDRSNDVFFVSQVRVYPVCNGQWVLLKKGEKPLLIDTLYRDVIHMLNSCPTGTVEDYQDGVFNLFGEEASRLFSHYIPVLIEDGILQSEEFLVESIIGSKRKTKYHLPTKEVTSLNISTCDRPNLLSRCIKSYSTNFIKFDKAIKIFVFDDSNSRTNREKNLNTIKDIENETGLSITYIGLKERKDFLHSLVKVKHGNEIPQEVLNYCLFGNNDGKNTYGVNYNLEQLYNIDELYMHADDDTFSKIAVLDDNEKNKIHFSSVILPFKMNHCCNEHHMNSLISEKVIDILDYVNTFLGKSVGSIVENKINPDVKISMESIAQFSLNHLIKEESSIASVQFGHYGDSGMENPYNILFSYNNEKGVFDSFDEYQTAKKNRIIIRGVSQTVVSDSRHSLMLCAGFDNTQLLPPFLPIHRNSDAIFGSCLKVIRPFSLTAFAPYSIYHELKKPHTLSSEHVSTAGIDNSSILIRIVDTIMKNVFSKDPEYRMKYLGNRLVEVADLPAKDLMELTRPLILQFVSQSIMHLEKKLDTYPGAPDFWVEDVVNYMDLLEKVVQNEQVFIPLNCQSTASEEEALLMFQDYMRPFGQLLIHWPAIVEAAREIKAERGEGPV